MIVIGETYTRTSLTAVAVDEVGREVGEETTVDGAGLLVWSGTLPGERLWAIEDCRQLTRGLERDLVAAGERMVRVPPKLTAPQRRTGRERGKSDPIDALAVARAALRELKMLVDHRDCLVAERTRAQQRLRWHLHELDPGFQVPVGGLDRAVWLRPARTALRPRRADGAGNDRAGARRPLPDADRTIREIERDLEMRTTVVAPGFRTLPRCPAAAPSRPRNCSARSDRSTASPPTPSSPGTPASRHSRRAAASTDATASTAEATANSTGRCIRSRSPRPAHPPARAYMDRKQAEGKSHREALRSLKRHLARAIHTALKNETPLT